LHGETVADQRAQLDLHAEYRFDPGYALVAALAEPSPAVSAPGNDGPVGRSGVRHVEDAPH
jgi:hypothetical protein